MSFNDELRAQLQATNLPPEFRWSFRDDGITTLHYGSRNVVLELDPKLGQRVVQLRSRPIAQRARGDAYPELVDAGSVTLEELQRRLESVLAPFQGAQAALV